MLLIPTTTMRSMRSCITLPGLARDLSLSLYLPCWCSFLHFGISGIFSRLCYAISSRFSFSKYWNHASTRHARICYIMIGSGYTPCPIGLTCLTAVSLQAIARVPSVFFVSYRCYCRHVTIKWALYFSYLPLLSAIHAFTLQPIFLKMSMPAA